MHQELQKAVEHLVEQVLTYESDTWSSSEYGVTREDAERAAALLIYNHLFDHGIPLIDGADVGLAVESIDCDEEISRDAEALQLLHDNTVKSYYGHINPNPHLG